LRPIAVILLLACLVGGALARPVPVVFHAEDAVASSLAARFGELWTAHGTDLQHRYVPAGAVLDTVHCLVLSSDRFAATFGDVLPDWGVGVAMPHGRLIAIDHEGVQGRGPGPDTVFIHEMAHALVAQTLGGVVAPRWFHEGVAMRASGEWRVVDSLAVILSGRLPSLESLGRRFPGASAGAGRAYRTSLAAVTYLEREHGSDVVREILAASRQTGDFEAGFAEVTGRSPAEFSARFAASMRVRYGWVLMLFRWPTLFVIMALLFTVGAIRKLVINRRAMRAEDEFPE
jgi:hypothetical protein